MTRRGPTALLRVELGAVAATFLVFSLLHLGVSIGPLSDAHILAGGIAEAILCACLAAGLVATFIRRSATSTWGLAANGVATLGVLLGILATSGGTTALNFVYHRTVLGVVVLSFLALIVVRALPEVRRRSVR